MAFSRLDRARGYPMLEALLSLLLPAVLAAPLLGPPAQAPQPPQNPPPSPEAVRTAVDRLEEAFTKGKSPERISALDAAGNVPDAKVIEWVAKGMRDVDGAVSAKSVETLRFMEHPAALEALHAFYRQSAKRLEKDEEGMTRLLKAIAQHRNKRSIEILADDPFVTVSNPILEARILGLGNIRAVESVEALMSLLRSAGRVKVGPYMPDFRLALMRVTGADQGVDQEAWLKWWSDHKKDFKVAAEPPPLPPQMQYRWDTYWGTDGMRARQTGRGDRGKDPEGKGPGKNPEKGGKGGIESARPEGG
jgi:hypothetical protein